MARFSRTIHIDAPPGKVFALVADPTGIASLDPSIQSVQVEQADGKPRAVRMTLVASPAVPPICIQADVTAYEPGSLLMMQSPPSRAGPRFAFRYLCVEAGGGTDLTCDVEIVVGGLLGGIADAAIRRKMEQGGGGALDRVKRILEGPADP